MRPPIRPLEQFQKLERQFRKHHKYVRVNTVLAAGSDYLAIQANAVTQPGGTYTSSPHSDQHRIDSIPLQFLNQEQTNKHFIVGRNFELCRITANFVISFFLYKSRGVRWHPAEAQFPRSEMGRSVIPHYLIKRFGATNTMSPKTTSASEFSMKAFMTRSITPWSS